MNLPRGLKCDMKNESMAMKCEANEERSVCLAGMESIYGSLSQFTRRAFSEKPLRPEIVALIMEIN